MRQEALQEGSVRTTIEKVPGAVVTSRSSPCSGGVLYLKGRDQADPADPCALRIVLIPLRHDPGVFFCPIEVHESYAGRARGRV